MTFEQRETPHGGTEGGVVTLNKVWGRTQDIIYTKSGEKVFLTALIFGLHYKAFSNIRKWKIVQKTYGEVEFLIVKGPEYSEKDEEELRESFRRHADIGVGFRYVSDIALTRAGKSMFLEQYLEES